MTAHSFQAGSFAGIAALVALRELAGTDATIILGSFGATAVLLYGAPAVPFSQPRNVIGGLSGVGTQVRVRV